MKYLCSPWVMLSGIFITCLQFWIIITLFTDFFLTCLKLHFSTGQITRYIRLERTLRVSHLTCCSKQGLLRGKTKLLRNMTSWNLEISQKWKMYNFYELYLLLDCPHGGKIFPYSLKALISAYTYSPATAVSPDNQHSVWFHLQMLNGISTPSLVLHQW